jgi:DNA-binding cell septation regulator SpoVG
METLITGVTFTPMQKPGNMKAMGRMTIGGVLTINFRVMDGTNGLWIGLPGRMSDKPDAETGKPKWYSDVSAVDKGQKEELDKFILEEYSKQVSTGPKSNKTAKPSDDGLTW